jgi:hypothetical protein
MERALALPLFWAAAIVIGFITIWIISRLSKGRVQVDLYAAINCFLYFALLYNIHFALTKQSFGFITVIVISVIIYLRKRSSARWI